MELTSLIKRRSAIPRGLREPPLVSGGLPLLGHGVDFIRDVTRLLFRAHAEHGEVGAMRVGPRRMVALIGPEAHEAVFRAPDRQLSARKPYKLMTPVFGKGIAYDAPEDRMDQQLKMLLGALKDGRMRSYGGAILDEVDRATEAWGESGEIDIVSFFRQLTMYTSTRCLIGREFREHMTEKFAALYGDLERSITPLAFLSAHLPLPSFRRRDEARAELARMIAGVVAERRKSGLVGEDFLQTLMEARYTDGKGNTDDEITGLLLAVIFAGHHTSSVTAAWTIIELLRNPAYLARVRDELVRVFGENAAVTYGALREITATENATKEALRLHPPLVLLVRAVMEDFVFRDFFLREGTWIMLSPLVAHRIPKLFPDPERFDPDRFSQEMPDFAFIPFGGGRHKCLGNAFALLQVKAVVATLLLRFDFELTGDPVRGDFHGTVVGPVAPVRIRYERRRAEKVARTNGQAKVEARDEKRVRLFIDHDLCQGHTMCIADAPDVFYLGPDGKARLHMEEPPAEAMERVKLARRHCPTHAIRVRQ
jgi:sterol 14-demethylase